MNATDLSWLRGEFERTWPLLEKANESHPDTYRKEDVWATIEGGHSQLWPMKNSAVVTYINIYPTGMKELRGWLTGGDLQEIISCEPTIAAWGKNQGCRYFVVFGRRGWLRVLRGYSEAAVLVRREL